MGATEDPELIHPYDFFRVRERSIVPDTCFVLMPFKEEMKPVYRAIQEALESVGVGCNRSDTECFNGTVLHKVMQGISSAEVIIADLTGGNPNVFYELGLAHVHTKDVVLIATKPKDLPFNLNSQRCHFYQRDLPGLQDYLRSQAAEIRSRRVPRELKDRTERTRQIVSYLREARKAAGGLVIRQQAAMSSLSNIGPLADDPHERSDYYRLLEQEQNEMVECLRSGAGAQLIITPLAPAAYAGQRWKRRMARLLEVLGDDNLARGKLDVAVMPYTTQNLLFIGDEILFEGHKTNVLEGGFQLTSVYTNRQQVLSRIAIFSTLFASACEYTTSELQCRDDADSRRVAITRYLSHSLETLPQR